MNFELKGALVTQFGSQIAAAKALGLSEWRLSRIVQGWDQPRGDEIERLAGALGVKKLSKILDLKTKSGSIEKVL